MNKKKRIAIIVTILIIITFFIIKGNESDDLIEGYFPGNIAYDFTLEQIDNTEISLSDYQGKSVMIVFWASWWPSCNAELPVLRKVYEELETSKYEIISINVTVSDNIKEVAEAVEYYKLQFPILLDYTGDVSSVYGIRNIPTNIIVGPDGIVRENIVGPLDEADILEKLEKAYN